MQKSQKDMLRSFLLVSWPLIFVVLSAGCQQADQRSSGGMLPLEADREQEQLVLFLAEGLPKETRDEFENSLLNYIEVAEPGGFVHILRCPDHYLLSSFEVPPGKTTSRVRLLRDELAKLVAFLKDESQVPADYAEQVAASRVLSSLWSVNAVHSNSMPTTIGVFGNPVYHAPDDVVWSMRGRRVPSISSPLDPTSTSPFQLHGQAQLPTGTKLIWVAPQNFSDHDHQNALRLFYRRYFDHCGIELLDFTHDTRS
ncbi:MAG: hypothetical protein WBD31_30720, partial [Rubripirellula sp.]